MSRYYFRQAEIKTLLEEFKYWNIPVNPEIYTANTKAQRDMIFDLILPFGYKGSSKVADVLSFIYDEGGLIDRVVEARYKKLNQLKGLKNQIQALKPKQQVNINDFFEYLEPETSSKPSKEQRQQTYQYLVDEGYRLSWQEQRQLEAQRRQIEAQEKKEEHELNKMLRPFTHPPAGEPPYLQITIDPLTEYQSAKLRDIIKDVYTKFFESTDSTKLYLMVMETDKVVENKDNIKDYEKLERVNDIKVYTLGIPFLKELKRRIDNDEFIKHFSFEQHTDSDDIIESVYYKVGFSSDNFLHIKYREYLHWVRLVPLEVNENTANFFKHLVEGMASAGQISNKKLELIAKSFESEYNATRDRYKSNQGTLFKYYLHTHAPQVVKDECYKLQIFTKATYDKLVRLSSKGFKTQDDYIKAKQPVNDACLIWALRNWQDDEGNKIPEETIDYLIRQISCRELTSHEYVRRLLNDAGIRIIVYDLEPAYTKDGHKAEKIIDQTVDNAKMKARGITKVDAKYTVQLNLYKEHWFLEHRTNITSSYLDNLDNDEVMALPGAAPNKRYIPQYKKWYNLDKTHSTITSKDLVKWLMEHDYFSPMSYYDIMKLPNLELPDIADTGLKPFDANVCCKSLQQVKNRYVKQAPKDKKDITKGNSFDPSKYTIMAGDFEAVVIGTSEETKQEKADHKGHKNIPFQVCVCDESLQVKTFNGFDCAQQMLNSLPDKVVMYFHNLSYDINFLAKYGVTGKCIKKGAKTLQATIRHGYNRKKVLILKDSACLFECKLEEIPMMFHLNNLEKDVSPYNYFTKGRIEKNIGNIDDACNYTKDPDRFKANIDKIPGCRLSDTTFDIFKYSQYYCEKDVMILMQGLKAFRALALKEFQEDIYKTLTAPSIAAHYFDKHVFLKNPKIKALAGIPAAFIRKCVHGGRCMSAWGKKWRLNKELLDFDAKALYPSAMRIMVIPQGNPKIWNPSIDLNKVDMYFVRIRLYPLGKHYPFPLIPLTDNDTGNLKWSDTFTNPVEIYCSKVVLEDIIEFYTTDKAPVKYDIIEGLYYDEGVDTSIRDVIKKVFDERNALQKAKNPMEKLYKLVMNSCYGKMIQKPLYDEIRFVDASEWVNFLKRHYQNHVESTPLEECNTFMVKLKKSIVADYRMIPAGVLVLDYSKRIMNRVMCLAYDIGCKIYYQDTDSMHIEAADLDKLAAAYKSKYNDELVGSNMGQFHSDFKSDLGKVLHADKSLILGKKMYIDRLVVKTSDQQTVYDYHIRMKGISRYAIERVAEEAYGGDIMKLYQDLYEGKTLNFDLVDCWHPVFKLNNDYSVEYLHSFSRELTSKLEEGDPDKYF